MTRVLVLLLVAGVSVCGLSSSAHAQACHESINWTGYSTIDVWIHPYLAENLIHAEGAVYTDAEIELEIKSAFESLQEHAPSNAPRIRYRGFSSGYDWDDRIPNSIHVTPWLGACSDGTCGCKSLANISYTGSNGASAGILIHLKRSWASVPVGAGSSYPCNVKWEPDYYAWTPVIGSLRGTLVHELGHALGLAHPYEPHCWAYTCTSQPCDMMGNSEANSNLTVNPYRRDWDQLLLRYNYSAPPSTDRKHRESYQTGLTWNDLVFTTGAISALSSAHSYVNSPFVMVGVRWLPSLRPALWRYTPSSAVWDFWGSPSFEPSLGMVGAAEDMTGGYKTFLSYLTGETYTQPIKAITLATYSSSGAVTTTALTAAVTRFQGTAMAYDVRTDSEVIVFRDAQARVSIMAYKQGVGVGAVYTLANYRSNDPPTVTCGESSITYNCVVAWPHAPNIDSPGTLRTMRWMHFRTSTDTFGRPRVTSADVSSVRSSGYHMYGPVSVAYVGPTSSNCAYIFAWKNPGTTYYTRCKSSGATASFTSGTERAHVFSGSVGINSPAVGAGFYNIELLNSRK